MFTKLFEKITQQVKNIISIGIWGIDGLELDNCKFQENNIDFELSGAQAADMMQKALSTKEKSDHVLIKIIYPNKTLVLLPVNEEFFYMIFAENNVIITKLEFYLGLINNDVVKKIS